MLLDDEMLELVLRDCTFRGGRCVHSEEEAKRNCAAVRRAQSGRCIVVRRDEAPAENGTPASWLEDWY